MSTEWIKVKDYTDIKYETTDHGAIAKITINRPEVRNAFWLFADAVRGLFLGKPFS